MAIYAAPSPTTAPLSTKLVLLLGLTLLGVGGAWAVADQVRGMGAETQTGRLPSDALPGTLPNFDHVLQYAGLLVVAVCAAGFLVMARAVCKMR
jgi:hypothetical protein